MPNTGFQNTERITSRTSGGDSRGTFAGKMLRTQMGNFRVGYITENGRRLTIQDVLDYWIPKIESEAKNGDASNLPSL